MTQAAKGALCSSFEGPTTIDRFAFKLGCYPFFFMTFPCYATFYKRA